MMRWFGIFASALLASLTLVSPAFAQLSPYPLYRSADENGVDLVRGDFMMILKEGSIGSGVAELELIRTNGTFSQHQWDQYTFERNVSGGTATIRIGMPGGFYEEFTGGTGAGGPYTTVKANGASLTGSAHNYTYTSSGGTKIRFVDLSGSWEIGQASNFCSNLTALTSCIMAAERITEANGNRIDIAWDVHQASLSFYDSRIASVSSRYGYSITFLYQTNTWVAPGGTWHIRTGAEFRNTKISPNVQASVSYAYPSGTELDFTDMAGNVWRITDTSIRRPGEASPYFTVTLSGGKVTSVTNNGVTTTYTISDNAGVRTLTKTNPLNQSVLVTTTLSVGRPSSIKDPLNRTTSFQYDSAKRLTRVTQPEGNYVQYTLDSRGNATQTQAVAKSGSGLAPITTSAIYPATCTNVLTCNKPTSTTDAGGNVTDYTYDPTHGGVATVTRPPPSAGGIRPQTRYTYSQVGTSPSLFWMLTGVSECQTTASCTGAADEVKTVIGYDSNANPTTTSKGNGTGTLTATNSMTYDAMGNLLTVDGPLAGTADTTRYRYDAARRQIGVVSPDPDGAGILKNRAVRTTYDTAGRVTKRELGTVNGQTDPDWAAFASLQQVDVGYSSGRVATQKLSSAGTNYALTQLSYDAAGRPECSAVRMNPAVYASLPASACTLGTAGTDGDDRITKAVYNAAGEVTENRVAVATADEAAERTLTYTSNGKLQTLKDAENNLTTYEYDGHDRLTKTRFPVTTKGANASSTTDFELLSYDAAGNVTQHQLRAPSSPPVINYTYDALNRVTLKDLPPGEPDVTYAYDNLGRLTSASQTGNALTFTFDALSRQLSEVGPLGTVNSQYDLAGRRTQLSTSSGYTLNYQRLVTGEMTAILDGGNNPQANFFYDNLGQRTGVQRYGIVTSYSYDPVSRLSSLTQDFPGGTVKDLTIGPMAYNPASQITSQTRSNDSYAWTGHGSGSTASTANGLNQLNAIGGGTPTYDARGNLTFDPTSGKTYGYSSENRLTSASGGVTLSYDPLGRLYQVGSASGTRRFLYATGEAGLPEPISEYDGSNVLKNHYGWGPGPDEPMLWYDGTAGFAMRTFQTDERGSVIAVSDSSGSVLAKNKYDEFGKPQPGNAGPWQYTGQMWLPELGLYYYKTRFYAAHLGRFMQTDPVGYGVGPNLYTYVRNDPVNLTDPLGLCPVTYTATTFYDTNGNGRPDRGERIVSEVSWVGDDGSDRCSPAGIGVAPGGAGAGNPDPQEIVVTAYWRRQKAAGNPIARLGLQFCYACPADWDVAFARRALIGAIAHQPINGRYPNAAQVRAIYNQIRVALMYADIAARSADISGIPGLLSAGQIYDYHVGVYSSFGLPATTFGGSYATGSRAEAFATSWLWCTRCDR